MKKQNIVNLVRYHAERNESAFISEVAAIAGEFEKSGDTETAEYLMELVGRGGYYVPQSKYGDMKFISEVAYSFNPLFLPDEINDDIMSITKAANRDSGLTKFLFYGKSGSGKSETAYQMARILKRDILSVSLEDVVELTVGRTVGNISVLFEEIAHLPYGRVVVILDNVDAVIRKSTGESEQVVAAFMKGLDSLDGKIVLIATTTLPNPGRTLTQHFDKAISFNRYSEKDLIDISDMLLLSFVKKEESLNPDKRLLHKILRRLDEIPYPGDLKQIIRTAVALSNEENEYDYLRRIYLSLSGSPDNVDIQKLKEEGYTTREIEILSGIPKSTGLKN